MSALNTFEEEIQDRKRKELAILNSLLDEKKDRVAQIKNERLTEIKEKYDHPPPIVMMITAYGDPENYNQAIKLGADDFLTKPIDFPALKEKLKNLV